MVKKKLLYNQNVFRNKVNHLHHNKNKKIVETQCDHKKNISEAQTCKGIMHFTIFE